MNAWSELDYYAARDAARSAWQNTNQQLELGLSERAEEGPPLAGHLFRGAMPRGQARSLNPSGLEGVHATRADRTNGCDVNPLEPAHLPVTSPGRARPPAIDAPRPHTPTSLRGRGAEGGQSK